MTRTPRPTAQEEAITYRGQASQPDPVAWAETEKQCADCTDCRNMRERTGVSESCCIAHFNVFQELRRLGVTDD